MVSKPGKFVGDDIQIMPVQICSNSATNVKRMVQKKVSASESGRFECLISFLVKLENGGKLRQTGAKRRLALYTTSNLFR